MFVDAPPEEHQVNRTYPLKSFSIVAEAEVEVAGAVLRACRSGSRCVAITASKKARMGARSKGAGRAWRAVRMRAMRDGERSRASF